MENIGSGLILSGLSCLRCIQVNKWSTRYLALGLVLTHVALPLTVTIHNYNFINCEDRILLNRCVLQLWIFDLQVTKKSFSLFSLVPLLPQIVTDAAHGRWFHESFCPHFLTLHPVRQWRMKGSLARSMIIRRCYVTIRLVKTEKKQHMLTMTMLRFGVQVWNKHFI